MRNFLSGFDTYKRFENYCFKEHKYCPNKDLDIENGNYSNHPICHWCRITFDNAVIEVKDYVRNKLE